MAADSPTGRTTVRALPASVAVPAGLAEIASRVDARIDALLACELDRWTAVDPSLAEPFDALRRLVLAGGKRLRPAFCHWAFVGAGGRAGDAAVVDAGAALELLHTFALIHDDIMDGSSTRRALDTIHVSFEGRHLLNDWRGERRRFGEGVAILVGDLAFVYADTLLTDAPPAAIAVFNELRIEVNVGQYLDLAATARGDLSRQTAQRISQYKSGKYTVERPLHLGAALAGRLDELATDLTRYGMPLGEAFQLRDDLLGVFGDTSLTGKPVGEDLREGKPTMLCAIARERAGPSEWRVLERFGAPDLDGDEVAALQELLIATGARDEVEGLIDTLVLEATAALDDAPLSAESRVALCELAGYASGRDH
jgi:geranylgeranyl diphosphate synthase, type I